MASARKFAILACLALIPLIATAQPNDPLRLTLDDAIRRGLQHNLGALVAEARVDEAEGTLARRQALLFPRATFDTPITEQTRNLRAMGIDLKLPAGFPQLPEVVGPFTTYEFRVGASGPIIDRELVHVKRAAERQVTSAKRDYQQARNDVVRQIATLYLSAQSAQAQVTSADAQVRTAEALHNLAVAQRSEGVATGIDVVRAQVRLSRQRQALVTTRNTAQSTLLVLARNLGLPPSTNIALSEVLQKSTLPAPSLESAMQTSLGARSDYQSLLAQREAVREQQKASRARFLPRLLASGQFEGIGRSMYTIRGVGQAQASLQFTIFDRDRQGEAKELAARANRLEKQLADLQLGVEQQIRQAVLNLNSAAEEVAVAEDTVHLAERELDLAKVRFESGVTNNVEVVDAQDALAAAEQSLIIALTHDSQSRIDLAYAMGNTEQNYQQFLGTK
ncbi:MAG TPA: TolC family protein [Terriglobales bacterium]